MFSTVFLSVIIVCIILISIFLVAISCALMLVSKLQLTVPLEDSDIEVDDLEGNHVISKPIYMENIATSIDFACQPVINNRHHNSFLCISADTRPMYSQGHINPALNGTIRSQVYFV